MHNTFGSALVFTTLAFLLSATTRADAPPAPPARPLPPAAAQALRAAPPLHPQAPVCPPAPRAAEDVSRSEQQLRLLEEMASSMRWLAAFPTSLPATPPTASPSVWPNTDFVRFAPAFSVAALVFGLLIGPLLSLFMTRKALREAGLI